MSKRLNLVVLILTTPARPSFSVVSLEDSSKKFKHEIFLTTKFKNWVFKKNQKTFIGEIGKIYDGDLNWLNSNIIIGVFDKTDTVHLGRMVKAVENIMERVLV